MFINDNYPRSVNDDGLLEDENDWKNRFLRTKVGNNVAIGSNATILGGVKIGKHAIIRAGAVITKDVDSHAIVVGNDKANKFEKIMNIPFLDLKVQYIILKRENYLAIQNVLDQNNYSSHAIVSISKDEKIF